MSVNIFEREAIMEYFSPKKVAGEEMKNYLHQDIFEFLKTNDNLNTISDRILFSNKTQTRPYEQVSITKFLTPDFNCNDAIAEIAGCLTGSYLFFVDFHFLFTGKIDEDSEDFYKFQTAAKATAMNDTYKITSTADYTELVNEFREKTYADLLNACAQNHTDLYEYENSGLRPYQLLSLVIHIQKFPNSSSV